MALGRMQRATVADNDRAVGTSVLPQSGGKSDGLVTKYSGEFGVDTSTTENTRNG